MADLTYDAQPDRCFYVPWCFSMMSNGTSFSCRCAYDALIELFVRKDSSLLVQGFQC